MDELMNMMNTTENYIESREVAEMIGKAHSDLLKDIRRYCEQLSQGNFTLRDFFKESEFNNRGKKYPCYLITKKGCELIAHKLTGTKGTEFTAKYIERFHKMENTIKQFVPQTREQLISMALIEANKVIVEQTQLIENQKQEIEEKSTQIKEMKPKVSYFDKVMQCPDLLSTTDIAKDYGWSAVTLNKFLKDKKIQYKNKNSNTWYLYQKYAEKGYASTKTNVYFGKDGKEHAKPHMYWTQKGRLFIYKTMKENGILPIVERDDFEEDVKTK